MKSAPFTYHAPTKVSEALALLTEFGDEAKILAGGQSLLPMLAMRITGFGHLIDLNDVAELHGIETTNSVLTIGAMTRQSALTRDTQVAEVAPLLRAAAPLIGHFQIRNRGTVGGSLAHADPASELPAVALALKAQFEVRRCDGTQRIIDAKDFFLGLWTTALTDDEILLAVHFPFAHQGDATHRGYAINEVARRHGDFALAGAVVHLGIDAADRISDAEISLFGVADTPVRAARSSAELTGLHPGEVDAAAIAALAMEVVDAQSDLHATAKQRERIAMHMCEQAITRALGEARNA